MKKWIIIAILFLILTFIILYFVPMVEIAPCDLIDLDNDGYIDLCEGGPVRMPVIMYIRLLLFPI